MMNNMINGNITSIEQMTDYIGRNDSLNNVSKTYEGKTFADIYKQKRSIEEVISDSDIDASKKLKFSKHAGERLNEKAISKGIKESLVIIDDLSFIVNTKNRTVITAMDQNNNNDNIYTNIDGAVII